MQILKNIGAVIAGMFMGGVVNMALILICAYVLWPMPPGTDFENTEAMRAYVASVPVVALLWVIMAHLSQAFMGGWVAARLGSLPIPLALVIGGLSLIGGVVNLINLEGPVWMWIEIPLYLVAAAAGGQLELKRRASLRDPVAGASE